MNLTPRSRCWRRRGKASVTPWVSKLLMRTRPRRSAAVLISGVMNAQTPSKPAVGISVNFRVRDHSR
ncbi:MAG: hypothetical protein RL077_535 [Verrucomicrobiota bacterium]